MFFMQKHTIVLSFQLADSLSVLPRSGTEIRAIRPYAQPFHKNEWITFTRGNPYNSHSRVLHVHRRESLLRSGNDNYRSKIEHDSRHHQPYGDVNNKRPRRHFRKRNFIYYDNQDTNVALHSLESLLSYLFLPIPLPWKIDVPLVYLLSVFLSAAIIPPITWGLFTAFFGGYLSLATAFMNVYDDFGSACVDEDENFIGDGEEEGSETEYNGVIPLAAFTGALASSALLSPQGLFLQNSSFSLASPVALIALLFGGVTILMGLREIREQERIWQEEENQERVLRKERREMNHWDNEIDKSGSVRWDNKEDK